MIVLNGKKILATLSIIITVFLLVYAITGYNVVNINKKEIKSIETVALPVNDKVIVIDAGHGVPDEGAESRLRNYRSRK